MTAIPGIGRRISNIVLKKAEVDLNKRAGAWRWLRPLSRTHAASSSQPIFAAALSMAYSPLTW
jgi:hypothetical protein